MNNFNFNIFNSLILTAQAAGVGADFGGDGVIGSVSHLISALMQTVGLYLQAEILKNFSPYLIKLAGLCYICSVISAIISTAIFGSYRKAVYFLLGPTFFYFIIETKAPVSGTQFRMGKQIRGSIEDQKEMIKRYGMGRDLNEDAQVSFAFLAFDNVISSIVQDVTDLLVDTAAKEDILIRARERVYSWVMAAYPASPGFIKLVSLGYTGYCAELMSKVDQIRKHKLDPTKSNLTDSNLDETGKKLKQEYNTLKKEKRINIINQSEVTSYLNFTTPEQSLLSCEEIWNHARQAAINVATNELEKKTFNLSGVEDPDQSTELMMTEVKNALSGDAAQSRLHSRPEEILAAYIIRSTLKKTPHSAMVSGIYDKIPFNAARHDVLLKDIANAQSYGAYSRIQYFAGAIPYIQGLLLLLLTAAFPFFAVLLVMPNRSMSFMIWGSLWVWVKSWDIGFAMILVIKKIMWQFISHSINAYSSVVDWNRPETIFELIAKNDPLASLNTYLQITALLTCSIPLLTAHFCLGATNLFGAFKMSIDDSAQKFGNKRAGIEMRLAASRAEHSQWLAMEKYGKASYDRTLDDIKTTDPAERLKKGYGAPLTTKDGQLLSARGDDSGHTAALIAYQKGKFDYHLSKEGTRNAAYLSALTGRETHNAYMRQARGGTVPLSAEYGHLSQTFLGNNVGAGGVNFFGGPNSTDYGYNNFFMDMSTFGESVFRGSPDGG